MSKNKSILYKIELKRDKKTRNSTKPEGPFFVDFLMSFTKPQKYQKNNDLITLSIYSR